ncbi:MAG: hypothetical protein A2Y86_01800 [Candidatus Aminicenantes bacterium RBG_13_62_12]|nr:MAG: hypothetical protein A2Y86_01800 [Candidatus Aminicenantes bacterium RBG_13_62_12]
MTFGLWDGALLLLVSLQATALAYVRHAKWKALLLSLPVPFTLGALAVGLPVNTTHVAALNLLLGYTHAVRLLHDGFRLPILPSIVLSASGYCGAGVLLRPVLPQSSLAFWLTCLVTLLVALAARALSAHFPEEGERRHLPPWIKFPIVASVILSLIVMKKFLQEFMALFPMVGVVASYESRRNLGLLCRAMPDFLLAMVPMMAAVRLVQPRLGLGAALALGWLIFLPSLWPMFHDFRAAPEVPQGTETP